MATTAVFITFGPFFSSGALIGAPHVFHYLAGTTTLKDAYTDRAKTTTAAQPLVGDAGGVASAFFDGLYKIVVKSTDETLTYYTWDNVDLTVDFVFGGTIRVPNNTYYLGRNAADNGDISLAKVNASNQIELGATVKNFSLDANPSTALQATTKQYVDLNRSLINLLPNSSLSISTAMPLRRIGNPITITSWGTLGSGAVQLSSAQAVSGHCEGLVPGKLILIEGPGTPHTAHVGLSASATTPSGIIQRITAAASSFTGLAVGDNAQITGGTNTDSRGFYRVLGTDASTYIEIPYTSAPVEGPVTYNITYYDGANKVDSTLNGMPASGAPQNTFVIGYPLLVTEANVGSFAALLPGDASTPGATGTARAWEVTPGIFAQNNGSAPDGWGKSTTLELYREYRVDTDGLTSVIQSGEDYGVSVVGRASSGVETFTASTLAPADNREKLALYKGRTVTLGAWTKAGATSIVRLWINDGVTSTYSAYFTSGTFEWKEVTATISTAATQLLVGWELAASPAATHHLTQPMLIFGSVIGQGNYVRTTGTHNFTAHPNFNRKYVNGANSNTQNIRIAQESGGAFPNGLLKGLYIGLEAKNTVAGGTSSIIISDKIPLIIPNLTLYAQVANLVIVNSGYAVLGRLTETYPTTWVTDTLGYTPGNATWSGINLDMFAAELQ